MKESKTISITFPNNVKLSSKMGPISEEERIEMSQVPHVSDVGSLMFAMICIRQAIAHASVVAMSTTKAEYVVATQASTEVVWLKMLEEIGNEQEKITLFCYGPSALYLARNPAFHL
ncbi:hypothetical protein Tco_1334684 [Tanacetum coccineum]